MSTTIRKIGRRSAARTSPKVLDETPEIDLSQTNALNQLNLDASTVVFSGKVVAKSPKKAKKSPARTAKKSPTRKAKKSPVAKKAAKKVTAKKAATKKRGKKAAKKVTKSKRPHNTKPTALENNGICVGAARVRSVLVNKSLNPREFIVRNAIAEAENKPIMPKPTEEDPEPTMPPQGPQVAIEDMHPSYLAVIREAEAVHECTVREGYERAVLSGMTPKKRTNYLEKRKAAHAAINEANEEAEDDEQVEFVLQTFNEEYDPKFYKTSVTIVEKKEEKTYNGYTAYAAGTDGYVIGDKYNQWTRASALVNKLSTRLSGNTRYIVATFLDRIVEQYAYNGIKNCLSEDRHIVQLRHALTTSEGFEQRVPLDAFVKTFKNYAIALNWIEECRKIREEVKKLRAEKQEAEFEIPDYPDMNYDAAFDGYVGEICRSVKMRLSAVQKTAEEKSKYMDTSVSCEFKRFCSYVIYEAILRIGAILRTTVTRDKVKTVSDPMVEFTLETIHNVVGLDFGAASEVMSARLAKFAEWRAARKEERRLKKLCENDESEEIIVEDDAEAEDDEDDAEAEDDEEVEADDEESDIEVEYEEDD